MARKHGKRSTTDVERPSIIQVIEHYFDVVIPDPGSGNTKIECPFHEDNSPSCSVNVDKNLMHCFSCQWSGDSYTLIQEREGTDFVSAQQIAEEIFGVSSVSRPSGASKQPRVKRISILDR